MELKTNPEIELLFDNNFTQALVTNMISGLIPPPFMNSSLFVMFASMVNDHCNAMQCIGHGKDHGKCHS